MTQEELKQRLADVERAAEAQRLELYRQYVKENAKYKVGQIIGDGGGTIRIEKVSFSRIGNPISIFYTGPLLTKKLEPCKNGDTYAVFEECVKRIIGR